MTYTPPSPYDCTHLDDGTTCGDCHWFTACEAVGATVTGQTVCCHSPTRFAVAPPKRISTEERDWIGWAAVARMGLSAADFLGIRCDYLKDGTEFVRVNITLGAFKRIAPPEKQAGLRDSPSYRDSVELAWRDGDVVWSSAWVRARPKTNRASGDR